MDEILDVLPDQTGPLKQVDIEERQAYLDFWKTNATLWNIYRKFIQPQSEQKKWRIKITTHQEQEKNELELGLKMQMHLKDEAFPCQRAVITSIPRVTTVTF